MRPGSASCIRYNRYLGSTILIWGFLLQAVSIILFATACAASRHIPTPNMVSQWLGKSAQPRCTAQLNPPEHSLPCPRPTCWRARRFRLWSFAGDTNVPTDDRYKRSAPFWNLALHISASLRRCNQPACQVQSACQLQPVGHLEIMSQTEKKTLSIKTGMVKRLTKELSLYSEDYDKEAAKFAKLKESGADEYDVKYAVRACKGTRSYNVGLLER